MKGNSMIDKAKTVKHVPGIKKDKEIILQYQHPYRVLYTLYDRHVPLLSVENRMRKEVIVDRKNLATLLV